MSILPNPNQINAETLFRQRIDAWGYEWMTQNHPDWVEALEQLAQIKTPDEVYQLVLRETQSSDLARFARQTVRHARRQND